MKVIFMGTPEFAVPSLEMLLDKHEVMLVVTQPDKPKGRGKKMVAPVVKEKALEKGIEVVQPDKIKAPEFVSRLMEYQPDVIVVVAFGRILPQEILDIPKYGCINVHGSLLPKYRGAGPIQWSIINGEEKTGVTTMYMAKGLDSGDMILQKEMEIDENDTYGSLSRRMSYIGADLLDCTLEKLLDGTAPRIEQRHTEATVAPMITKEMERIDWSKPAADIRNLIRGLNPQPGAYTLYQDDMLKIWNAALTDKKYPGYQPGAIVEICKNGFIVNTGSDGLLVSEVQAKGGKKMGADAYLRGHAIKQGTILC